MQPQAENIGASSVLPGSAKGRLWAWFRRVLPLRYFDPINHFRVQTRLLFSRSIVMMVVLLLGFFGYTCIVQGIHVEEEVFMTLSIETMLLAVVLSMNLWESEREGRTYELLLMRIPNLHRLIWFKMRVGLIWLFMLSIPFYAGLGWFAAIDIGHMAVYVIFTITFAMLAMFLGCIVSTFVRHNLATGVITLIIFSIIIPFFEGGILPYKPFYQLFVNPFPKEPVMVGFTEPFALTGWWWVFTLIFNRLVLFGAIGGLYWWLKRRLAKTELWIE